MKFRPIAFAVLTLLAINILPTYAQSVSGTVRDGSSAGQTAPLPGASIYWLGTTQGTTSDGEGKFTLARPDTRHRPLIISFVGYKTDTLHLRDQTTVDVVLRSNTTLQEVVVESRSFGSRISAVDPMKTEKITTKELQKAACCNLSESFETNASVDVSFSDAVTGAKQIQMLGLDGVYVQINSENVPSIRGLSTVYGLNYTPGTWVSSIDVGKGAGSVVNGYESITGQINVELQKPEDSEKLFLNTYINDMGRGEINLNSAHKLNKKWSTGVLLHTSRLGDEIGRMDRNGDGFLDTPMFTQYNGINRWKYDGKRFKAQFGVKALYENRKGGQMAYYDKSMQHTEIVMEYDPVMGHEMPVEKTMPMYGTGSTVRRLEAFAKTGIIYPQTPYKGLGLVTSAINHEQDAFFGNNPYRGRQRTLYANLIYQTIIGTTDHAVKMGASYLLDDYREAYQDSSFARTESVPGVFGEYTYTVPEKFTAVAGLRTDFHNLYGPVVTPRLHLKYNFTPTTALRASAGSGFRVPNPIAENTAVLVSSRELVVRENLRPEKAWNYGASLTHDFTALGRNAMVSLDFYRTDFTNQLVVDMDSDPSQIAFYNLQGKSFANSAQVEVQFQPVSRMDVKAAYKFYDVQTTIGDQLIRRPFVSRDRVLFNVGYATKFDKWKFDFTTQWIGAKRIPSKFADAGGNRGFTYSPDYALMNAQVTRSFRKWDVYLGGENLGNFRQADPIVDAGNPFGPNFDASLNWGPIYGRMIYAGMRFKVK
jgi:hypothetical protein